MSTTISQHHGKIIGSLVHLHLRSVYETLLTMGPIDWKLQRGFQACFDEEPNTVFVTGRRRFEDGSSRSVTICIEGGSDAEPIVESIAVELLQGGN